MKYAVLGDIHANIEALEAVLGDAGRRGAERYISTGDVVGYNASPAECMDRLATLGAGTVQGNHDHYAAGSQDLNDFNPVAARAIRWTQTRLNAEHRRNLAALPLTLQIADFTVVHSSLCCPEEWKYIFTPEEAAPALLLQPTPLCFYGHTHRPAAFRMKNGILESCLHETLTLAAGWKYLINAGSVGQPRDGDPRAAYVMYDDRQRTVSLYRVAYDLPSAQARIRAAGLPEMDALRLAAGY
jgi:predicted phosphodiesterase